MQKITIVEDDPAMREELVLLLENEGYQVQAITEFTEVVAQVRAFGANLVLLDLGLPGRDGFSLCADLRKTCGVPIILVTSRNSTVDGLRALSLGGDDYITKPLSPSELVARVRAHLARYARLVGSNQPTQAATLQIRDIKIDKSARRVWIRGEETQFTTKEFELLAFLAEHPNHVFSKQELFKEIWDMDSVGDIATVTVHIKKIREKIDLNTNKPQYIETIWGVGYRFKV